MAHIYRRYNTGGRPKGPDAVVRHPEWTRELLTRLERPDHAFPVIMVTGSKGKGSTAWYLASLLEAHGLKTGFFAGPHLLDNLERLRLNGRAVTADRFLALYGRLKPHLDAVERLIPDNQYLGPVGIFAALAALWYAEEEVNVAVFETGRGARFDDVNEVRHAGAIVTSVLLEHVRELGSTLSTIAWHKLGILKPETTWAILPDTPAVQAAWTAEGHPARVTWDSAWALSSVETTRAGTAFTVDGPLGHAVCRVPALAHFAAENGRRALLAASQFLGRQFDWTTAQQALEHAVFPGRAELLPTAPPLLLDGTIRRESARSLLESLREAGWLAGEVEVVVGVPADKDWEGVADEAARVGRVDFVDAENPRLHFPPDPTARRPGSRHWPRFQTFWESLGRRADLPDVVLVLGTQSLVADVFRTLDLGARLLDLHAASAAAVTPEPAFDRITAHAPTEYAAPVD